MSKKLWGGRFKDPMHPLLKCFSYSLHTDIRLLSAEIEVNRAYTAVLTKAGILKKTEAIKMIKALDGIERSWKPSKISRAAEQYEDLHAMVQGELEKQTGELGKKIHTGRSRNDLVATSTRLYLRGELQEIDRKIKDVQRALIFLSKKAQDMIIPGLTHLKKAQPVLAAHHLLAYVEMLEEDRDRLKDSLNRINVLPLGSAALGGSALKLDRRLLARKLGFSSVSANSMAATADRAFAAETLAGLSILWMHLSRMAEDFILWNSEFFDFIELDDSFATGSSLMPQKKNPDVYELVRGGAGPVFGALVGLLTLQKGLPLCYNRDLQEDKPGLFAAIEKTHGALAVLAPALKSTRFKKSSMMLSLEDDTLYATDLLEYLVKRGVAFSDGHAAVGQLVRHSIENKKPLRKLDLKTFQRFSKGFSADVFRLFDPMQSIRAKQTEGSTNPARVHAEIRKWGKKLK